MYCRLFIVAILSSTCFSLIAQSDTEFEKGFVMHLKLQQGMITQFHRGADLYQAGIYVAPQTTVIPHILRLGIDAGAIYASKELGAMAGPVAAIKLKTLSAGPFGSTGNIQLQLSHLWGTGKQQMAGGGFYVDLLNKLLLGASAHRDYNHNSWWFQTALGFRLTKPKKVREIFNE